MAKQKKRKKRNENEKLLIPEKDKKKWKQEIGTKIITCWIIQQQSKRCSLESEENVVDEGTEAGGDSVAGLARRKLPCKVKLGNQLKLTPLSPH